MKTNNIIVCNDNKYIYAHVKNVLDIDDKKIPGITTLIYTAVLNDKNEDDIGDLIGVAKGRALDYDAIVGYIYGYENGYNKGINQGKNYVINGIVKSMGLEEYVCSPYSNKIVCMEKDVFDI